MVSGLPRVCLSSALFPVAGVTQSGYSRGVSVKHSSNIATDVFVCVRCVCFALTRLAAGSITRNTWWS